MFSKLRNRIIIITMAITTVVLILSGVFIMLFSSTMRPDPKPRLEVNYTTPNPTYYSDEELQIFIKSDREEGTARLLITLLCVGTIVEVAVFVIIYYLSEKIVNPVKDSYDKQKLFIANASHELKTPLAVIEANIEALDVDSKNEKWKTNIESEITHANKLVLDLLQLAKMDAGSLEKPTPTKINLNTEISQHIEMFKPKFPGNISFKSTSKDQTLTLPKQDFLQVLDILLDNATKYGNHKININLDKNKLTVANDGTIIKKDDIDKIFDRFYQTDKTKPGSGLGLAILKALCDQNDWKISCESTKNQTKFILVL